MNHRYTVRMGKHTATDYDRETAIKIVQWLNERNDEPSYAATHQWCEDAYGKSCSVCGLSALEIHADMLKCGFEVKV